MGSPLWFLWSPQQRKDSSIGAICVVRVANKITSKSSSLITKGIFFSHAIVSSKIFLNSISKFKIIKTIVLILGEELWYLERKMVTIVISAGNVLVM
jgi:hypothetical protein